MIRPNMSRRDIEIEGSKSSTNNNLAKIIDDFYLYTDQEEQSVGQWLSKTGYWESWITSWMTKNINPGDTCIDLGANYGYYTRIMERLSGPSGIVHSIEANPELCDLIKRSIKDFPIENGSKVVVHDIAISDRTGVDTLSIASKFIGGSSLVYGKIELPSSINDEFWDKRISVKTDTLDNLLNGHINLLKIDIEGAEPMAWPGMKNTLENTDIVVIECGGYSPPEFLDEIFNSYKVSYIDNGGEEIPVTRSDFNSFGDLVMAVLRK